MTNHFLDKFAKSLQPSFDVMMDALREAFPDDKLTAIRMDVRTTAVCLDLPDEFVLDKVLFIVDNNPYSNNGKGSIAIKPHKSRMHSRTFRRLKSGWPQEVINAFCIEATQNRLDAVKAHLEDLQREAEVEALLEEFQEFFGNANVCATNCGSDHPWLEFEIDADAPNPSKEQLTLIKRCLTVITGDSAVHVTGETTIDVIKASIKSHKQSLKRKSKKTR